MQTETIELYGCPVTVNHVTGHLEVLHNGNISWDILQKIKNSVWGVSSRAIEVYPKEEDVVNNVNARHLWLLGSDDFCPDLLGIKPRNTLENRYNNAWEESNRIFG